jgi:hypothetical protein
MRESILRDINRIIEQEGKTSSYKFALLRGVIDMILDNSPYIRIDVKEGLVHMRMGLLIEKWILYFYPIFESEMNIPQIHRGRKLAFDSEIRRLVDLYKDKNGLSGFYRDLKLNNISYEHQDVFISLAQKLKDTIARQPMRYLGTSVTGREYGIFKYSSVNIPVSSSQINQNHLAHRYGVFSIPIDYYEAFRVMGSMINGHDSILFKWAQFSSEMSGGAIRIEQIFNHVLRSPVTERDARESRRHYQEILGTGEPVKCVWTEQDLLRFDVDHLIPFSIWKNNDLWNLLPSSASINQRKRDRIPDPDLIDARKDIIISYWRRIQKVNKNRFDQELTDALIGGPIEADWETTAVRQLEKTCKYLIYERGYPSWNGV